MSELFPKSEERHTRAAALRTSKNKHKAPNPVLVRNAGDRLPDQFVSDTKAVGRLARTLYEDHKTLTEEVKDLEQKRDEYWKPNNYTASGDLAEAARMARNDMDANLWRAHGHKEQHLSEYITQAKEEAEAAGIDVDLGDQKE